jgi:nucleotide-binding universal stress UspA family protein
MPAENFPVLVAVADDATPSVRYAVEAAARSGCGVHLLHVVTPGSSVTAHVEAERLLYAVAALAEALVDQVPDSHIPVSTELAHAGPVAAVIVERASRAREVVLQRRHDVLDPTSTSAQVARAASCPVVLVPEAGAPEPAHGPLPGLAVTPALPGALP